MVHAQKIQQVVMTSVSLQAFHGLSLRVLFARDARGLRLSFHAEAQELGCQSSGRQAKQEGSDRCGPGCGEASLYREDLRMALRMQILQTS